MRYMYSVVPLRICFHIHVLYVSIYVQEDTRMYMYVCIFNFVHLHVGSVVSYIEAGVVKYGISNATISCLFLNNQSFYCVVCCSTDPSVPPDSSVYNISTSRGTEVTVDLDDLTSGQMYYCKVAATNTTSASCGGPVVGGVKVYFNISAGMCVLVLQPVSAIWPCGSVD